MTPAQRFCPTCGAPTPDEPLDERGRCRTCYLEEHELVTVPETIAVDRCGACGSLRIEDRWTDDDRDLAEVAIDLVADRVRVIDDVEEVGWEVRTEPVDDRTIAVTAMLDLLLDGGWEQRERTVEVAFPPSACRRCSRIAGDDYGATVQLRATDRRPDDSEISRARAAAASVLESRVDAGDRDAFLTDVVERDEGIDLRLSTPRLGDQVATAMRRDLGGTLETAPTLVTTDGDGRDVYRVTFTLRLGPYRRGDVLATDDGVYLVEAGTEGIRLLDLRTGAHRTVTATELDARRVTSVDEAESITVVAPLDDRAVQVLHPETSEAVTVSYYDGVAVDEPTVEGVTVDGAVYLLPNDGG